MRGRWPPRRKRRDYGVTAEEIARRGDAEFEPSFEALKEAVDRACAAQAPWEAAIVAGVRAVVEFAIDDTASARALTVCAGALGPEGTDLEAEIVAYFAERLERAVPVEMLHSISSAEGIVETAAMVIRGNLLSGNVDLLPALGPDLVYLTLMPYLGLDGAKRWAATFQTPHGRLMF